MNRSEGSPDRPVGNEVDEEQLRRYAALMDDFRRENEAKALSRTVVLPSSDSAAA